MPKDKNTILVVEDSHKDGFTMMSMNEFLTSFQFFLRINFGGALPNATPEWINDEFMKLFHREEPKRLKS